MGKMELGIYCYLIADILTKLLQKCSLTDPLPNILFLLKTLNLIGYHDNQKAKFAGKKIRLKLKLRRIVSNISLYIIFFAVAQALWLL